jgi:hypothetical protein
MLHSALEQDAETALREMNGRELRGRNMILETAVVRGQHPVAPRSGERKPLQATDLKRNVQNETASGGDFKQRKQQLIVFGVGAVSGKKVFRKYLKSLSRKATVNVVTEVSNTSHARSTLIFL